MSLARNWFTAILNGHAARFLVSQRQERSLLFSERMKEQWHGMARCGCTNFKRQLPDLGEAARHFVAQDDGKSA